jgi:hypothetical protein
MGGKDAADKLPANAVVEKSGECRVEGHMYAGKPDSASRSYYR